MTIADARSLIEKAPRFTTKSWLDLGCGNGTFTYALAELLPSGSTIYAVDIYKQSLKKNHGQAQILFIQQDFEKERLNIPPVEGIILANALHFVKEKPAFIRKLKEYFTPTPIQWILVEYEDRLPNQWVPYPVSFSDIENLFIQEGYPVVRKLAVRESLYGGQMYSAYIQ